MIIDIDENKYTVIDEKHFSDYKGSYRVILYDTGFYGLQELLEDKNSATVWKTILICPLKDFTGDDNIFSSLFSPKFVFDDLLNSIDEADRSFNGDYWTLQVFLEDDTDFMEVITRTDAETLLEQMNCLMELENENMILHNESYAWIRIFEFISYLLVIFLVIYAIFTHLFG